MTGRDIKNPNFSFLSRMATPEPEERGQVMKMGEEEELLKQLRDTVRLAGIVAIELMQDEDMANALATFYKNLFDALRAKDFSIEAALQLVCNAKPPTLGKP